MFKNKDAVKIHQHLRNCKVREFWNGGIVLNTVTSKESTISQLQTTEYARKA